jgi:hypothetical protein
MSTRALPSAQCAFSAVRARLVLHNPPWQQRVQRQLHRRHQRQQHQRRRLRQRPQRQQQGQGCQRAFKMVFSNPLLVIAPRMARVAPTTLSALQTQILLQGSSRQRCVKGAERAAAALSQPRPLLRQHLQRRRHQHRLRQPRCRRHQQRLRHLHQRQRQGQACQRAFKMAFSNPLLAIAPRMAMVAPTTLSALQTQILLQGSLRQRCVKGAERAAVVAAHSQPRRLLRQHLQRRRHQLQRRQLQERRHRRQ